MFFSDSIRSELRAKSYESREACLIQSHLREDRPVIDLGAGIGFTTCLIDQHTTDETPVVGIEANEDLVPILEQTKLLNGAEIEIDHSAYDSQKDETTFYISPDFWSSGKVKRLPDKQIETTVRAQSLEQLLTKHNLNPPVQLVVDTEGAEHDLICNEMELLNEACELLIVEFHSFTKNDHEYYVELLEKNNFRVIDSRGEVYCFKNFNPSG
jgi:FkbM family methyltransferase